MVNLKKLCFTAFIFGSYQKYIPYYIYSISEIYPDTYVKLFIDKDLDIKVSESLNIIRNKGFSNFQIIFHDFHDLNYFNNYKIKGGGTKTLFRWLFDYKYFKEFDYLYYGDVDIIILPEKISLLDLHIKKVKEFGIPLSNMVRRNEDRELVKRLTGLHFVEVKPYFEKINPIIDRILNENNYKNIIMQDVYRDEQLLYEINKEAFNFNDELLSQFNRPLHGLHLGGIRNVNLRRENISIDELNYHLSIPIKELKINLVRFYSDTTFKEINKLVFLKELYVLNKFLNIRNPHYWVRENFKIRLLRVLKKVKLKIKINVLQK